MNVKKTLITLLAGAALVAPAAAFADHDDDRDSDRRRWRDQGQYDRAHRHHDSCEHRPATPVGARGRYELRTVSTWVEGQWVRDYVPGRCFQKRNGKVKCRDGHSVDRWVPGHYQDVEQWVWVPHRRPSWNVSVRF